MAAYPLQQRLHGESPGAGAGKPDDASDADASTDGAPGSAGWLAPAHPELAGARILVVDDDPDVVQLLALTLRDAGFLAVDGVTDPRLAVGRFRALQPDLVLLDLRMPHRDGLSVLEELRRVIPPGEFVPIVVLSGDSRYDRRLRALDAGASDFLLKPFHPAEVVLRVRGLLSLRMSHAEQVSHNEHLEALVRERTRDMYEHGEFLRALLDCLDEGIVALDSKGELRLATDAVRRLGIDPRMLGPNAEQNLDRIYTIDQGLPLAREHEPLTRAFGGENVTDFEMAIEDTRGSSAVQATARPIVDATGKKIGAVMALRDVTERRRVEADFRHRAMHDPLTDLANRALFLDRLEQALAKSQRTGSTVAVFFIDIDNFKVINDTLGHAAGDRILTTTAERLRQCIRPGDTPARFGGDEFAVLCEDISEDSVSRAVADRIKAAVSESIVFEDHLLGVEVSIGIALAQNGAASASELLRCADAAMFSAKERGGGRAEIFHESLRSQMLEQIALIPALRTAITAGELVLHYQPTIVLETGGCSGVEALVRWQRVTGELLGPASFVPIAEQSGLITAVDAWVLRGACRQLAHWQQLGRADSSFTMSVNLSARRLTDPDLAQDIRQVLIDENVDPSGLCIEITETALLRDAAHAARTLESLRDLGVRVAVDDFGTGYSSLAHLRRLPIDIIKIDRSFVAGLPTNRQDGAIVHAVIDLAKALDLVTVAEGVETAAQVQMLRELRCDIAQGFHFAEPAPADQIDLARAPEGDARVR